MKKISFLLMACSSMLFVSCSNAQPEFKFNLQVDGEVFNTPTNIDFTFDANVSNLEQEKKVLIADQSDNVTDEDVKNAYAWLDGYVKKNIIDEMPPETQYNIHVFGTVHESLTGITISVNKEFKN